MKTRIVLVLLVLSFVFSSDKCFSANQSSKNLVLKTGYSYLLSFDEKVNRYSLGNKDGISLEILSSIFNNGSDVIIKPNKKVDTNLIVWTSSGVYNFNISAEQIQNNVSAPAIQSYYKTSKAPIEINSNISSLEIDKPPYYQDNSDSSDFELDEPPKM